MSYTGGMLALYASVVGLAAGALLGHVLHTPIGDVTQPPVTIEGTLVAHDPASRTIRIKTDAPATTYEAIYEADSHIYRRTYHSDGTTIIRHTLTRDAALTVGARISLVQPRVNATGIIADNILISYLQRDQL